MVNKETRGEERRAETLMPELILPGDWDKGEGFGQVRMDVTPRIIRAPRKGDPYSTYVRAHEYGHVKWSPLSVPKVESELLSFAIGACEDARINNLLLDLGVETPVRELRERVIRQVKEVKRGVRKLSRGDQFILTSIAVSIGAWVSRDAQRVAERVLEEAGLQEEEKTVVRDVMRIMYNGMGSFETTLRGARILAALFGEEKDEEEGGSLRTRVKDGGGVEVVKEKDKRGTADSLSGRMTIVTHRRELNNAPTRRVRRRMSDVGMWVKRPDRILTDGRVFEERMRGDWEGTILIDYSGSMSLTPQDLDRVARVSGRATVAAYSGRSDYGELHILAEGGRRVREVPKSLVGNVIDVPALRWLVKRRGERVWVTDEEVTGKDDWVYPIITAACKGIVRRGRVRVVRSVEEAIRMVEGGRTKR